MQARYDSFSTDDFIEDRFFISWIKTGSPETEAFWKTWIASQPSNINAFREAEQQMRIIFSAKRIINDPKDAEEVWFHIGQTIGSEKGKIVSIFPHMKIWMIAASVIAVVLVAGIILLSGNQDQDIQEQTSYGQLKTISLPDSSVIRLNANSSIEYLNTGDGAPREVYLKGEAFFEVVRMSQKINTDPRFIVHTDLLKVEVLGTAFNVKERRGVTEVSLERGSLRVTVKSDSIQQLLLSPGELAEYNSAKNELKKIKADPAYHKDWTEEKMLANNTTVATIIQEIEDVYGYKVILDDTSMRSRRIDGTIPMKNEENVLFVLSNMLNVDIEKKPGQLHFKKRK
jgi:transmembrane sensor